MFELRNHPAQARCPFTGKPAVDDAGKPVPLLPDHRAVYVNGILAGYFHNKPGAVVCLVKHVDELLREQIQQFVANELGGEPTVCMPPEPPEEIPEEE